MSRPTAALVAAALLGAACGPDTFEGVWQEPEDTKTLCVNSKCARVVRTWSWSKSQLKKSATCTYDGIPQLKATGTALVSSTARGVLEVLQPIDASQSSSGSVQITCSVKAGTGFYSYEFKDGRLQLLEPGQSVRLNLTRLSFTPE